MTQNFGSRVICKKLNIAFFNCLRVSFKTVNVWKTIQLYLTTIMLFFSMHMFVFINLLLK